MSRDLAMTPVYDLLLQGSSDLPIGLYHLHMATAEQLCRLHYSPGTIKAVKARLKTLTDHGYVQHDVIPTKYFHASYYYTLTRKALRYLAELGLNTNEAFRNSKEVNKHALFVEHTLELNDVLIAAALIKRAAPAFYLHRFIHERVLKKTPYRASWKAKGRTETFTLIPDAFLDLRISLPDGKQRRMPLLLEHDRGSEQRRFFRRRIRAYITLLKAEAYKQRFGVKTIYVAFTTFAGSQRLAQMREWTRQELATTKEEADIAESFLFTNLTAPLEPRQLLLEPHWYMPDSDQPLSLLGE